MKWIGAVLVIGACTAMGWSAAHQLHEHERLWKAWETLLDRLSTELRYTVRPVQEVFGDLDMAEFSPLAWLSEYNDTGMDLRCPQGLCAEERAFAKEFFSFLGTSDLDGQLAHIARFRQQACEMAQEARERCKRLSGVYVAVGVCGGLCVGLVVI